MKSEFFERLLGCKLITKKRGIFICPECEADMIEDLESHSVKCIKCDKKYEAIILPDEKGVFFNKEGKKKC